MSPESESTDTRHLFFNDVTLRDGEQAPGNTMTADEKVVVARQLVRMGIPGIEAGFPIASRGDFDSVERIASEVGSIELPNPSQESVYPRISALARLNRRDIDAAMRAIASAPHRGIHTFISTSRPQLVKFAEAIHRKKGNPESMKDFMDLIVMPGIEEQLGTIREADPHAVIQFSPEDWTRTDEKVSDDVILEAARNGASIINLPDTVGIGIPRIIFKRVAHVRQLLDQNGFQHVKISWHGHNDTGQGVSNAMEAMYGGAEQFETTILGIGERTGNFSFESTLAAVDANKSTHEQIIGQNIDDTLVRGEVMRTARLVSDTIDVPISREAPIVGENAFAHEAGIHQQGVIAGRKAGQDDVYEILRPETYGAKSKIFLGKHSGWAGLKDFMEERGLPFSETDRSVFADALSHAADDRRKGLSDDEVLAEVYYPTVIERTGGPKVVDVMEQPKSEPDERIRVVVTLRDSGQISGQAEADDQGAVDAVLRALENVLPNVKIEGINIKNKPGEEGRAATAVAKVTLHNGDTVTMEAEHHNTEKAGVLAVQKAFNALWAQEQYAQMIAEEDSAE